MSVRAAVALLGALACAAHPLAARAAMAVEYHGDARAIRGDAFAYRESHFVERAEDGSGERVVLYRCEDGRPFARKSVRYPAGSFAPDFALVDARTGFREGVRTRDDAREVYVRAGAAKPERAAPLPAVPGLVADAGFDDFVLRHWDALVAGETLRFPFLVPGERDYIEFKVRRDRSTVIDGAPAEVFRLTLGAWYGRFLPRIDVSYTSRDRMLRRYEGLSNIRDLELDNVVVRIDFPPGARRALDPAAREHARAVALARSCS